MRWYLSLGRFVFQVQNIKSPRNAVSFYVEASNGSWCGKELRGLFDNIFRSKAAFKDLGIQWTDDPSRLPVHRAVVATLADFGLNLASNRAWSNMVWQAPPYTYARLLSARVDSHGPCMADAKVASSVLYQLDFCSHRSPAAGACWDARACLFPTSVRILFAMMARSRFSVAPLDAGVVKVLATMLQSFPDTRCNENTH